MKAIAMTGLALLVATLAGGCMSVPRGATAANAPDVPDWQRYEVSSINSVNWHGLPIWLK